MIDWGTRLAAAVLAEHVMVFVGRTSKGLLPVGPEAQLMPRSVPSLGPAGHESSQSAYRHDGSLGASVPSQIKR